MKKPSVRPRHRRLSRIVMLSLVAMSVMAMNPECDHDLNLLFPNFVPASSVTGQWLIAYHLLSSTCPGESPGKMFTAKANVDAEFSLSNIDQGHTRLAWAFLDQPDHPIRGPYDSHTGTFQGETGQVPLNGLIANEMWSGITIFENGMIHFQEGRSEVDFRLLNGTPFCGRVFGIDGERLTVSSKRFKRDVTALLPEGISLFGLRPVAFRYVAPYGDPEVPRVGLLAEEVLEVFPEAVVLDDDGRALAIRYEVLTRLLAGEIVGRIGHDLQDGVARLAATD